MPKKPPKKKRKIEIYDNGFGFDISNLGLSVTNFNRIASLKPQPSDNDNRIIIEWEGNSYAINQRTLNRYASAGELKAALDKWTAQNLGYVITDIWFHKNRDGTWAVATGQTPPEVWPEDEVIT